MSKIKVVIMGLLKKLGVRNIFSKNDDVITNIEENDQNTNIENLYIESNTENNKIFKVNYDKEIKFETIYLLNNGDIDQANLTFKQEGIISLGKYLIKFDCGEYIKIISLDVSRYGMFDKTLRIICGTDYNAGISIGVNIYCKNEIENFYDEYNRLLHDKIVTFSKNTKELQELAHNAVALCAEYTLLDLESIKFLYYEHTCFYKSEDFGDMENIKAYIGMDTVHIMDNLIQNMAEILEEEIDEPEATLGHAAFEAFMRAYIDHFASEYDKYIINEFGKNDISFKADDYCQYIKNLVEISDFDYDDKFIIALVCKLTSLGLLEGYDTIIDAYEAVVDEIEEAEKNKSSNLIKDMLRGRKAIDRRKYTIDEIDLMDGYMFEEFLSKLFEKMGYSAEVTKKTNDQGIDIIGKKNGRKVGIQAKCYSNNVGNSAIQEAVAGKSFYDCDAVMVVTNSYFTESAKKLARANDVILWDRNMLAKKIDEFL